MIADLKPYPAMKDSGVEWLGNVPQHWRTRKIKNLARPGYKTFVDGDWIESPYITSEGIRLIQTGNIGTGEYREKGFRYISEETFKNFGCTEIELGDVLICRLGEPVARACLAPQLDRRMITSVDVCILKPRDDAYAKFLVYSMSSYRYLDWVGSLVRGSTRDRVSRSMLGSFLVPVPPLSEQTAIVRFLDHADRRIQRYIRAKQKLIALLEEQKQAIIHQVVTGRIDIRTGQPYPTYKASGVEWLGEVPEHWDVKKLRQCGAIAGGMTPSMENQRFWNGSIPWVTPKDMKREAICDSGIKVAEAAVYETLLRLIDPPAVLMVVRGMILARRVPIAWITSSVTINQDMKALIPAPGINAEFLARVLDSAQDGFMSLVDEAGHGTRRLPTERWRTLAVAIPSGDEQVSIVNFLRKSTHTVVAAIDSARRLVTRLTEYRTRLVADVVTGKLDVREAAAALPEVDPLAAEEHLDDTAEATEQPAFDNDEEVSELEY